MDAGWFEMDVDEDEVDKAEGWFKVDVDEDGGRLNINVDGEDLLDEDASWFELHGDDDVKWFDEECVDDEPSQSLAVDPATTQSELSVVVTPISTEDPVPTPTSILVLELQDLYMDDTTFLLFFWRPTLFLLIDLLLKGETDTVLLGLTIKQIKGRNEYWLNSVCYF